MSKDAWEEARRAIERHDARGGIFLKLPRDGDLVTGVFVGDRYTREQVSTGGRYERYDENNQKHRKLRPSLRLAVNIYIPAEDGQDQAA